MSFSQPASGGGEPDDKAGLDFYFGRPTDMMRKLEASKFMNRGKAKAPASPAFPGEGDDYSQGMASLSLQQSSQPASSSLPAPSSSDLGEESGKTGGYLFKWQRDQRQDEGDEGEDDLEGDFPVQSPEANQAKHRARYQVVTGNTQPSSLSIAGYFDSNTIKGGKPIGRDGFVNCGGVILLPAAAGALNPFKQRLNFSELNEINRFETLPDADNLLSLRGEGMSSHEDAQVERLFLRRQNQVWPPEAPGFPPPPPDDNENVQYKKVALASVLQMQQQGYLPVRRQSRYKATDKLGELGTQASFKHHPNGNGGRLRTQSSAMESPAKIKPIPEKPAATGFFSRMLPSSLTKQSQFDSSQFPGVYSSFVLVPYILPPPPQPPKFPAPGSNEEKRLQRFCLKKMFLEDQYSTVLENVEERIRLNEVVREMEKQIMESDVQINQLIGQSDAS